MRVSYLIQRSIAKRCVSKDEAMEVEIALVARSTAPAHLKPGFAIPDLGP
jgi:hypothetical protein